MNTAPATRPLTIVYVRKLTDARPGHNGPRPMCEIVLADGEGGHFHSVLDRDAYASLMDVLRGVP
jgi:hypothetical protein